MRAEAERIGAELEANAADVGFEGDHADPDV